MNLTECYNLMNRNIHGNNTILNIISENIPVVIIDNDSVLITGDKLLGTFDRLEVAEFSAKSLILAQQIGTVVPISNDQIQALREKFLVKY